MQNYARKAHLKIGAVVPLYQLGSYIKATSNLFDNFSTSEFELVLKEKTVFVLNCFSFLLQVS